jgi:hypothetical protein
VAAGRSGVQTVLVERQGYLGGTGYAGMFQHICGLYINGDSIPSETLNGGLAEEIVGLLKMKAPDKSVQKIGQVFVLPYSPDDLQDVLTELLENEANVSVLRNSRISEVKVNQGNIRSVTIDTSEGSESVAAGMVVDCTGNGNVAAMAGAEFEFSQPDERQLAGFSIRVSGLKGADDTLSIKVSYYCSRAAAESILPPAVKFTTFTCGSVPDEGFIKMSIDGEESTDRDKCAIRNAYALFAYLGEMLPAFSEARIVRMSPNVLDREGRRILGDYMLTEEDILTARKFTDAIVKNAWPIELWDRSKGTLYKYLPRGAYYEIPFRCIIVKGITNLLAAGRCISVSHAALGSTRVMGACMALGEQAGKAGAYFARNGEYSAKQG